MIAIETSGLTKRFDGLVAVVQGFVGLDEVAGGPGGCDNKVGPFMNRDRVKVPRERCADAVGRIQFAREHAGNLGVPVEHGVDDAVHVHKPGGLEHVFGHRDPSPAHA